MTQLHELDAVAQAAAVRAGELNPVDLVEHCLDRADRFGDRFGVFVTVTVDAARSQALEAAGAVRSGSDLPALHGVPTTIKDLTPTADAPTSFGSEVFAGAMLPDAHVAALLRQAGTISLGKTNCAEFGLSAYSDTTVGGSARTPWDSARSAGGSSGGAAAAVATGIVPVAHGNDGGGSLRIPASVCGLFGFKPSRGRISNGPLGDDITGMACQGPLSRTVRDAAAFLDATAVPVPGEDVVAPPLPDGQTFLAATSRDPGRLRIARYADAGFPVDPACRDAYDDASRLLADLGHDVVDIETPLTLDAVEPFITTWAVRSLRIPVTSDAEDLLLPVTRQWREWGRRIRAEEFFHALTTLRLHARRALRDLDEFDAILTPTLAMPPQEPAWFTEPDDFKEQIDRQTSFSPYTAVSNITGQPAASVPLYWTADGLPIGVMLAGRPAGDAPLLSLCAQLENTRPWAQRWPSLPDPDQLHNTPAR